MNSISRTNINRSSKPRPVHRILSELMNHPETPDYLYTGLMLLIQRMPVLPNYTSEECKVFLDMHNHFCDGFDAITVSEVLGLN